MATLLEDEDLIAQAQERERARLEEEARLLALRNQIQDAPPYPAMEPPPVWQGSSVAEIDQFNAQPAVITGERTTIGSPQYNQELARAQAGSGFIAPDIGPGGNVITPGYDPSTDLRRIRSEELATRYKGQQLYQSLVQGGATPAEAYRAAGHLLNFSNPLAQVKTEEFLARRTFQPTSTSVGGATFDQLSPGRFSRRPPVVMPKMVPGRVAPDVAAQARSLTEDATLLKRALAKGTKEDTGMPKPFTDEEKTEVRENIKRIEAQRNQLLSQPEANPNIDQPSWQSMRERFNAAGSQPSAPVEETITITSKTEFDKLPSGATYTGKDGRRYRKP